MPFCQNCGTTVKDGETFCTSCGAKMIAPPDRANTAPGHMLTWCYGVPLITNPVLVKDLFLALFIPALLAGILFSGLLGDAALLLIFLAIAAGIFLLGLLIMAVLQLVGNGGLSTFFFISDEGVASKAGKGTEILNRISTAGSLATGSLAGTGAGLLAISEEANTLSWEDVRYVTIRTNLKMVVLRSRYLIGPVALYCTEKNFPFVVGMIRNYAPASATIVTK